MTNRRLPPRWLRGLLLAALTGFAALNLLAWHQAGCFLRYVEAGDRTAPPEHLQGLRKLGVLLTGVRMTRPRNTVAPAATTPPARVQRLASGDGEIEVWWLDHPQPRGTVLILPGYAEAKTDLLDDAYAWRDLGFSAGLVDFRGAGAASGAELSLGYREAEDVQVAAAAWVAAGQPGGRLLLYGHSMGGAAALRAVADLGVPADGVIAVSVFDRMRNAVRERFRALGVPAWPAGDLLVFWAGVRRGFNGFALNPADFAARSTAPLLILHGDADPRAPLDQATAIAQRAAGPVQTMIFPGAGHISLIAHDPARWQAAVQAWLNTLPPTP
jgi:alpha-beta hydrolase superfamily lysophospholipase